MKPAKGKYNAQEGDLKIEVKGKAREISVRHGGAWEYRKTVHWEDEARERIGCTCVAGLTFDQHCKHQDRIHAHTYHGLLLFLEQSRATGDTVMAEAYSVLAEAYRKEASACCTHTHPVEIAA
jgi:hypothetical protein